MEDIMDSEPCPVAKALTLFSGKWKIMILYRLSTGEYRYNELKRHIFGITNTGLTRALTELQRDGFVLKTDYGENPPRVTYQLTEYGKTLLPVLHAIKGWADDNMNASQTHET